MKKAAKAPLSVVDHILSVAAHLRSNPPSMIDANKPRIGLGVTGAQRQYALDKYVDEVSRGQK